MPTHFKDIVTFRVGRTSSGQFLDTRQGGVTVVAQQKLGIPWPITAVRIVGTAKTVHAPRWELVNITVVSLSETTADLSFKIDVPALGEQYRNFNTSQHRRDIDLRALFDSGGTLEMNVELDISVPLTVALPKRGA